MKKSLFRFASPLALLAVLLLAAACTPAAPEPTRALPPDTLETPYPAPQTNPTPGAYPGPGGTGTIPYPMPGGTGAAFEWQRINLMDVGLSLEIPSSWTQVPGEELVWEAELGSTNRFGVRHAPLAANQEIEAALLPPNSLVQDRVSVDLPLGTAHLFTIQVFDPAQGGGLPVAVEQHLLFRAPGERGYGLFISATNGADLAMMQSYLQHIQASIQISP
jgi:hypothetical protein